MKPFYPLFFLLIIGVLYSCNTTKYVGKGEYLLDRNVLTIDNKTVKTSELKPYIRQTPNHKAFGLFRIPLSIYSLSGRDSSKWFNRWLRKAGTPPVIYDPMLTNRSEREIKKALANRGYTDAIVTTDTISRKKKITVKYQIQTGVPFTISQINYNIPNDSIRRLVMSDTSAFLLRKGMLFDRNLLEQERQRISNLLRDDGYYAFNKEYITYTADTTGPGKQVDLELNLMPIRIETSNQLIHKKHEKYRIRNVYFVTNYDPMKVDQTMRFGVKDTAEYKGYYVLYGEKHFIRRSTLVHNCFIVPGSYYSNKAVNNTYSAFGRLRILKYVNIRFNPVQSDNETMLDCYILLTEGKSQTFSLDLEGTNSAGDLGFALGATYQHRNIFGGSETWSTKVRTAYESLSGDLSGIINDNYSEIGAETGITYPKFVFPFLKESFRKRLRASTEFAINANYQQRPEYTRIIAGAGFRYKWNTNWNIHRHHLDLIDISYIYLPKTSNGFLDNIAPDNPLLRYSYENHFIMRSAYIFYRTNLTTQKSNRNIYTWRAAGEVAGNLLNGISHLTGQSKGKDDEYTFLGIRYAQYAKFDLDYAYTFLLSERHSIALHVGTGVAIPYGNSEILPFEKRYFSGGANSVRGWSVRSLGPGRYQGVNQLTDFMNQCGDIRLDLNAEYRTKLIWKLELAAFLDAGNIWTIRDYVSQPGGQFRLSSFYKEIALAYGMGIRLDFNYFVLRLDLGIKAYDPSKDINKRWVITHQNLQDHASLHFAVGYPF